MDRANNVVTIIYDVVIDTYQSRLNQCLQVTVFPSVSADKIYQLSEHQA